MKTKTGKQIKAQIRRIAKKINTRITAIEHLSKSPAKSGGMRISNASAEGFGCMKLDDPAAFARRAALAKRLKKVVDTQAKSGLAPARRLMKAQAYACAS